MSANPTQYREGCGTHLGRRLHQANQERLCSLCLEDEAIRRLLLEAIPQRPTPAPPEYPEITPEQAEANADLLRKEVAEYERQHPAEPDPDPETSPARHLTAA